MVTRHSDVLAVPHREALPPLPKIDWRRLKQQAPTPQPIHYAGPDAPLPKADIVIITWTTAEWSALDHVFLNSDAVRYRSSRDFEKHWKLYTHKAPESSFSKLWGYYQLVTIKDPAGKFKTVLLFKSSSHLAHPPFIEGLQTMIAQIIDEVTPERVYSIGTAGGASLSEPLGSAAITNSARIELKKPENTSVDYNGKTFTCPGCFPGLELLPDLEKQLLFPLSNVVTHDELDYLLWRLHRDNKAAQKIQLEDLLNEPLSPNQLHEPRGLDKKDVPLLTTDYYFIATGDDAARYSALEMDDAVVAYVAESKKVDYAFVRNISDPIVPNQTTSGGEIPESVRSDWSGAIYQNFGIYSSFNGALITWATIAGR